MRGVSTILGTGRLNTRSFRRWSFYDSARMRAKANILTIHGSLKSYRFGKVKSLDDWTLVFDAVDLD